MRQSVAFNEAFVKPAMAFWWTHQPIWRFCKIAIFKDGKPSGANAHARVIGGFKVEADEIHGLRDCGWRFLRAVRMGVGGHVGKRNRFCNWEISERIFASRITKSVLVPR